MKILIKCYINKNSNIDKSSIYICDDSNISYMTIILLSDYPYFFWFWISYYEIFRNNLITYSKIKNIVKTPLWFVSSKIDTIIQLNDFTVTTLDKLRKIRANVHFSFLIMYIMLINYIRKNMVNFMNIMILSWIYVYNIQCE